MDIMNILIVIIIILVVALIVIPPIVKNNITLNTTLSLSLVVACGSLSVLLATRGNWFGCALWAVYSVLFVTRMVNHRSCRLKTKDIEKRLEKLIEKENLDKK